MSGFNDVKYFSKCFKKEFGHSPSEIKKDGHYCPSSSQSN
ncbi:helix-turn-helix domain-containing protein [Lutimonas sp.]